VVTTFEHQSVANSPGNYSYALWCGLSSRGFAAGNTCSWSTRTAASVGCGWHQPTSHCACPLNFCWFSGNYGGINEVRRCAAITFASWMRMGWCP
jgi:hypothetical protein